MSNIALEDRYQRKINYLRLSVTDRCNLRCRYCMPASGCPQLRHDELLSYEDLCFLVEQAASLGVKKVRITGGEPLIRRHLPRFIHQLSCVEGIEHLVLTTNGLLLADQAAALRRAGISRLNISIDSLRASRYRRITRGGDLSQWWQGLRAAQAADMRLKLNVVILKGINDDEVLDFAQLGCQEGLTVRFIEYMPSHEEQMQGVPEEQLRQVLQQRYHLLPQSRSSQAGPAQEYQLAGTAGSVGLISPLSCPFCHNCNRLRVDAQGRGRGCLFTPTCQDLKPAVQRRDAAAVRQTLWSLAGDKPAGHNLGPYSLPAAMSALGG